MFATMDGDNVSQVFSPPIPMPSYSVWYSVFDRALNIYIILINIKLIFFKILMFKKTPCTIIINTHSSLQNMS